MILHTCPHCGASNLYAADLRGPASCHSCGITFEISRFTRTDKDVYARTAEIIRAKATLMRHSRRLVYLMACLGLCVIAWAVVSAFGVVPGEWRMFNRRFATVADDRRLAESVGLIAVGEVVQPGTIAFQSFGTAVAITEDGYLLTCRHVLRQEGTSRIWIYINGRRLDARVVSTDLVSDWAIVKVDERLRYRFRVGPRGRLRRLNVEVTALGFQEMPPGAASQVRKQAIARTTGRVSRVYEDEIGTEWIEHTAVLTPGSSGGPLLVGNSVVGVNIGGDRGIYRALSTGPIRDRIWRVIDQSRDLSSRTAVPVMGAPTPGVTP